MLKLQGQDTVNYPLRLGAGAGLFSAAAALADAYPRGFESNLFWDLSEYITLAGDWGYSRFKAETHNYHYNNKGIYLRVGIDYNLLNPVQSSGRYYAGLSAKYGISLFSHSNPLIEYTGYWGGYNTSSQKSFHASHFLEISPGVRAELFRNFFIGWGINLRLLMFSGTGKDMRAIDIPGFGNGSKPVSAGFNYYLSYRIPYRYKKVIYIKPERDTEADTTGVNRQPGAGTAINRY